MKISQCSPQLLICFEYDQQQMEGPPFSIRGEDVENYYEGYYDVTGLEKKLFPAGLKAR